MRKDTTHTGFELLIDNWGTMEEWGRSDGGRTHRPRVKDLASFCRQRHFVQYWYIPKFKEKHNFMGTF